MSVLDIAIALAVVAALVVGGAWLRRYARSRPRADAEARV